MVAPTFGFAGVGTFFGVIGTFFGTTVLFGSGATFIGCVGATFFVGLDFVVDGFGAAVVALVTVFTGAFPGAGTVSVPSVEPPLGVVTGLPPGTVSVKLSLPLVSIPKPPPSVCLVAESPGC